MPVWATTPSPGLALNRALGSIYAPDSYAGPAGQFN
jgi:hypothetical protein